MAEAILTSRSGNSEDQSVGGITGTIRCITEKNANISCRNKDTGKTYTAISSGLTDISVSYGTWIVNCLFEEKEQSVEITISNTEIKEINFRGITYGIAINMAIGDPDDAVSYIDDAIGFDSLNLDTIDGSCNYGSWKDIITNWIGCKPCLCKNGQRTVYLNPDDYSKDIDGNSVDITSGNSGDVMVEFSHKWYKYSLEGDILKFEISNYDRTDEGFVDTAFLSEDGLAQKVEYIYFGAYEGYVISNKLRSLSNKNIINDSINITYSNYIQYAENNTSNGYIMQYTKLNYLQGLMMLVCKSRNIQLHCGNGSSLTQYDSSNNRYQYILKTGTCDTKGLFFGDFSTKSAVKIFGIENIYGNRKEFIGGIINLGSGIAIKACKPYNDEGNGYLTIRNSQGQNSSNGLGYPSRYEPHMQGSIIYPRYTQTDRNIGWTDYLNVTNTNGKLVIIWTSNDSNTIYQNGPFSIHHGGETLKDREYCARLIIA